MKLRRIEKSDNKKIADIIRSNLKAVGLDIPGTAYYDESLDNLSEYYLKYPQKRFYYIATDDEGKIIGGVGIADIRLFDECAELQKLYLSDEAKGHGFSRLMMKAAEDKALELGYKRIYLETHTVLEAAISLYEKLGYKCIEKPAGIVHSAMNRFYLKELG